MKHSSPRVVKIGCCALFLIFGQVAQATEPAAPLVAGSKIEQLVIGDTTYRNVTVRSVSARTAMITHDGGMKSLLLRDLPADLQRRFGYSQAAEKAQDEANKASQAKAAENHKIRTEALRKNVRSRINASRVDQLLNSFGTEPKVYREINLRPRFDDLGFTPKNQGYRPSCAIFSIISALEFQSAEDRGSPETFSEEYVYWATLKALGRMPKQDLDNGTEPTDRFNDISAVDAGFSLPDVITGMRAYGVITRDRMPNNSFGKASTPPEDVINDARYSRKLSIQLLPGSGANLVKNIVHALNAGLPVPLGMYLPDGPSSAMREIDSRGVPGRGHAVTVVGYVSPTGLLEDTVFTFRNSWGAKWGDKGYGTITYRALVTNAGQALVIELL